ncbi:hypothetical protein ES705_16752 [subsurface metagenome]
MANTFSISVAPEIEALEAKIDIVDTVVDAIRGTDVVNLSSAIANNSTAIGLIRTEDVPALDALLDINTAHLVDIINNKIPANFDAIDANNTILTYLNGTSIPAINTLVSALPTSNRATLLVDETQCTSAAYIDLVNITGSGKLILMRTTATVAADVTIKITIDGIASTEFSDAEEVPKWLLIDNTTGGLLVLSSSSTFALLNIDFHTSLRIQVKDASTNSWFNTIYSTD